MRNIKYIVIHCTATSQSTKVESIVKYWKNILKWKNNGYHYLIEPSGKEHYLTNENEIANGVAGYNKESIHISYIGGVDEKGKPVDNRTPLQVVRMIYRLIELKKKYPNAEVLGHRDFPNVKKDCPSFDVKNWLSKIYFENKIKSK